MADSLATSREWTQMFGEEEQLSWSDIITKELRDLNIRKELAHEWVEWQKATMPRKTQLQIVRPIRGGQALQMMGKLR